MSNDSNKILDRLFNHNDTELMPNELRQLLDAELAKPEDEMDTQLISDIIDLLDIEPPTPAEKKADWSAIEKKYRRKRRLPRVLRSIAITAASIVAVFLISLTSAKAFNWTFLLKFLLPVAQTFGIISSDYTVDDGQETEYRFEDATTSQEIDFTSLDDLPSQIGDVIVESNCVPDGYEFIQGTWFKSVELEKCNFLFQDGTQKDNPAWFAIDVMEFDGDKSPTIDFEYERQLKVPQVISIDGIDVTLYYNSDDMGISVSWLQGNKHFNLQGTLTEDDLTYIITALHSYL